LLALDAATLAVAWLGVELFAAPAPRWQLASVASLVVFSASGICVYGLFGLYRARVCSERSIEYTRLAQGCLVLSLAGVAAVELLPGPVTSREIAFAGALSLLLGLLSRAGYRNWLGGRRRDGNYLRRVLLVGCGIESVELATLLTCHPELGYRPVGVVGDPEIARRYDQAWCGDLAAVVAALSDTAATGAIICTTALEPASLSRVVDTLLSSNAHVQLSSGLRGIDVRRLRRLPLAHEPLFYVEPMSLARWQLTLKRVLDVTIALVGLVAATPVLALAALAIHVEDGGPVVFRQVRVGRDGESFVLFKLRTMRIGAEAEVGGLRGLNNRDGPLLKIARDPRVSRLGRVLRATSVDELPQLWNVLNGTMSLVGPRPALPDEVAKFDDEHRAREAVRPGITGLWQVDGRENPSFFAYRRFDLYYLQNWTIGLDLMILARTVEAVVVRVFRTVLDGGEDIQCVSDRHDSNAAGTDPAPRFRNATPGPDSPCRRQLESRVPDPSSPPDAARRHHFGSRASLSSRASQGARRRRAATSTALLGFIVLATVGLLGISWLAPVGDPSLGGPMARVEPSTAASQGPVTLPAQSNTGGPAIVSPNGPPPTTASPAPTPSGMSPVATAPAGRPTNRPMAPAAARGPVFTPMGLSRHR
jgi:exopolysaccharide biosynthesis polyprenyl glycosylphosphotransferase